MSKYAWKTLKKNRAIITGNGFTTRQHGGPGASDLGRKRCQTPKCVSIAIAAMQRPAIARMHALNHPRAGGQLEVAIRLDGDPSQVGAPLHAFGDYCPHHVAGPKAMRPARSLGFATRKAVLLHLAHLAALPARGSNQ
jgi:hypothetical protein